MAQRYLTLLRESDLRLLLQAAGEPPGREERLERLRSSPALLADVLGQPSLFEALFASRERDPLLVASPFLVFSVLVHRVARDLEETRYVPERLGRGRAVPVFDVGGLTAFLADAPHRHFLAELLASYTRVSSGSVWQRTARGWRRRRYSELDPLRLAELLEVAGEDQRAALCRRLGDLALFLTGVFPEHVAAHPLEARHVERIRRLLRAESPDELLLAGGGQDRGIWLLEWMGRQSYRLAAPALSDLATVVDGFGRARRVLNVLTERYLYPSRERWFPDASG